jgi:hypothetical protein
LRAPVSAVSRTQAGSILTRTTCARPTWTTLALAGATQITAAAAATARNNNAIG